MQAMREYNLQQLFGDVFDFVIVLIQEQTKQALLSIKDSGLYWLEDKSENAKLGAILVGRPNAKASNNASFDDARIKTVDNWAQLVNYVN